MEYIGTPVHQYMISFRWGSQLTRRPASSSTHFLVCLGRGATRQRQGRRGSLVIVVAVPSARLQAGKGASCLHAFLQWVAALIHFSSTFNFSLTKYRALFMGPSVCTLHGVRHIVGVHGDHFM